jgi:enamine deaminase RidA (YjgF/YER057c/UK114 family)
MAAKERKSSRKAPERDVRRFGTEAEAAYGFAQSVRVGKTIYISGQTASPVDGAMGEPGDMHNQMRVAYARIGRLLAMYDATMANVVDETLFVTDMEAAIPAAVSIRREVYGGDFDVASTLIGVQRLGGPDLLVEIKCTARL